MIPASKIIRFVGKKVAYFNPIAVLARFYINGVTKKEFHQPIFPIFNERPIEYRFVFEQI